MPSSSRLSKRFSLQQPPQQQLQPGCCTGCGRLPTGRYGPLKPHPKLKGRRKLKDPRGKAEAEPEGVPICQRCRYVYDSGTFTREDGVENFCRWCGDGGTLYPCDGDAPSDPNSISSGGARPPGIGDGDGLPSGNGGGGGSRATEQEGETKLRRRRRRCCYAFCKECILRNFGNGELQHAMYSGSKGYPRWRCYLCDPSKISSLLAYLKGEDGEQVLGMDADVEAEAEAGSKDDPTAEDILSAAEDTFDYAARWEDADDEAERTGDNEGDAGGEEGEDEEGDVSMAAIAVGRTTQARQQQQQVKPRNSSRGSNGKRKLADAMASSSGGSGGGSSGGSGGASSGSDARDVDDLYGFNSGNGNADDGIFDDSNFIAGREEDDDGAADPAGDRADDGGGKWPSSSSRRAFLPLRRASNGHFLSNGNRYGAAAANGGLVELHLPVVGNDGCFNWTHVTREGVIPARRIIDDISGGREAVAVSCVNQVDEERLPFFTYTTRYVEGPGLAMQKESPLDIDACCDCEGACSDESSCKCAQAMGGFAYTTQGRFKVRGKPLVRECGWGCACNAKMCPNRVVGQGIQLQLQVFRCGSGKGWGVRTLNTIPAGSFVADYLGELLPERDADTRRHDDEYLFNLDAKARDGALRELERRGLRQTYERIIRLTKEELADSAASRVVRDSDTGGEVDIVALYTELFDKEMAGGKDKDGSKGDGGKEGEKQRFLCVDAKWFGNVARFINHSCDSNMEKQAVLVDSHDGTRHRLALFATEDIMPNTELTYDYGYTEGVVTGKAMRCLCGSHNCRGGLL